jgi:predicted nucleic acid-binding protein
LTVIVADTSPLSYHVLIGLIDVLPKLFNRVLVPDEVIRELRASAAPPDVRAWAEALPEWIDVSPAGQADSEDMPHLDPGERAAITLAQVHPHTLLVIDDAAGRREAARRGIVCTGTVEGARHGYLSQDSSSRLSPRCECE